MAHDHLIALGNSCIDEYYEISDIPSQGEKVLARYLESKVGGMIGNAAAIFAGYGHHTVIYDFMNRHPSNRILLDDLEKYHVSTSFISFDDRYPQTKCQIMLKDGERIIFVMVDIHAIHHLDEKQRAYLKDADYLYTTPTEFLQVQDHELLFKQAKDKGLKIVFDIEKAAVEQIPDIGHVLDFADILFINEQADEALRRKLGDYLETYRQKALLILTQGENGSTIFSKERDIKIQPYKVTPVDTTGAGDTYNVSFLHGLTQGWDLEKCGDFASAAASRSILSLGPRTGVCTEKDVFTFMDDFRAV